MPVKKKRHGEVFRKINEIAIPALTDVQPAYLSAGLEEGYLSVYILQGQTDWAFRPLRLPWK